MSFSVHHIQKHLIPSVPLRVWSLGHGSACQVTPLNISFCPFVINNQLVIFFWNYVNIMAPNLSPNPLASTDSCLNHYYSGCKIVIFLFLTFLLHPLVDIFFSPIQFSKCFLWMSYNQLLSLFHCNAQIVSNMISGSLSSRKIWFLNGTR